MAAVVLTIIGALFIGGGAWLALGSRFKLNPDDAENNDLLNAIAYFFAAIPVSFVIVFFGIGG